MVESRTRFYNIWVWIKTRCNNPKVPGYKKYWWAWISLSATWHNYQNFKNDMYESYLEHCKKFWEKQTTIDRIDNKRWYSKNNCRWATRIIQNVNRRNTIMFTYKWETKCLKHWCLDLWLKYKTVHQRINAYNWTIKKALNL